MREGGPIRSRRVRALQGLVELLRVAEQDQAARGRRDGEGVGQRDLPGLVHDEDVQGPREVLARPDPGRAAHDVELAAAEGASSSPFVLKQRAIAQVGSPSVSGFCPMRTVTPPLRRAPRSRRADGRSPCGCSR
jgi:hypothetical protein